MFSNLFEIAPIIINDVYPANYIKKTDNDNDNDNRLLYHLIISILKINFIRSNFGCNRLHLLYLRSYYLKYK